MTSKKTLSSTSGSACAQDDSRSMHFLDLPLEVRIIIYTEITTRSEDHYTIEQSHPWKALPAILRTRPQMTREIYQFCTMIVVFKHKILWWQEERLYSYLSLRLIRRLAKKLIRYNTQADHKGAVLNIVLGCSQLHCSEGECCGSCRAFGETVYISRIGEMGLERQRVTLI